MQSESCVRFDLVANGSLGVGGHREATDIDITQPNLKREGRGEGWRWKVCQKRDVQGTRLSCGGGGGDGGVGEGARCGGRRA